MSDYYNIKPVGGADPGRLTRRDASDDAEPSDSDTSKKPETKRLDEMQANSVPASGQVKNINDYVEVQGGVQAESTSYTDPKTGIKTRALSLGPSAGVEVQLKNGLKVEGKITAEAVQGEKETMHARLFTDTKHARELYNSLKPYLDESAANSMLSGIQQTEAHSRSGDLTLLEEHQRLFTEACISWEKKIEQPGGTWILDIGALFSSQHHFLTVNEFHLNPDTFQLNKDSHSAVHNAVILGGKLRLARDLPISTILRMQLYAEFIGKGAITSGEGPSQVAERGIEQEISGLKSSIATNNGSIAGNDAALREMTGTDAATIDARKRMQKVIDILNEDNSKLNGQIADLKKKLAELKAGDRRTLGSARANLGVQFSESSIPLRNDWNLKQTVGAGVIVSFDNGMDRTAAAFWPVADFNPSQFSTYGGSAFVELLFSHWDNLGIPIKFSAETTSAANGNPRIYMEGSTGFDYKNWEFRVNGNWYRDYSNGKILNDNVGGGASVGYKF